MFKDVIHRDIELVNILISGADCNIKIIDFGLACDVWQDYLKNFDKYMSHSIRREANCKDDKNNGLFACINTFGQSRTDSNKINLFHKDDSKRCIITSMIFFNC